MNEVILLTGANGFLGTYVARWLVTHAACRIVALVRAKDDEEAARRLSRAWWDWPELAGAIGERVEALAGDVTQAGLGLNRAAYLHLAGRVTRVIHAAADVRLNAPLEELRRTNAEGTAHVLELARAAHRHHGLRRFAHVSTAYVAGTREGDVPEGDLTDQYGFATNYERSKYEAETMVQEARAEMPVSVFRPGMIVGDSSTGAAKTFNTIYFPLRMYLVGKLRIVPASPSLRVNLVPVDWVAEAVGRLTLDPQAEGRTFHLTAPPESLPRADELAELARQWARDHLNLSPARARFVPALAELLRAGSTCQSRLGLGKGRSAEYLLSLLPYFGEKRRFLRHNTDNLLGPYQIDWRRLVPKLLQYAVYAGFLHRSERTVHEQVLFRLQSRSRPVTYHDLAEGRVIAYGAAEVRRDMLAAASSLCRLGVQPGDRMALVGLNSTRYLVLDVAIGLVGGVSVPMYYTSPPADLEEIVARSGARLLFVGAPKLLARLDEVKAGVPVISFCRNAPPEGLVQQVTSWEAFLALGTGGDGAAVAPVSLSDPATLRYTSGTTGVPKGAIFQHSSLRFMAESLASLVPWKTRNSAASYLSFLPMNHVVEGILATYAPYYVPAPLDIYFLEEFRDLPRALPLVRPSIFFSVPRFYAKVWESFRDSSLGRWYLAAPGGLPQRLARPLLKWAILWKAGLDRCSQLIAGSAPFGEDVMQAFRQLGIEIHNAYGLTEAPLVSLNRMGANRLGTVGEPLPQTQVRVGDDGEVMVRGPQVMAGYYGEETQQPFQNGWLLTGDLGRVMPDGSLLLQGRKKEIIVTAYGKNIFPLKIEAMLRDIPGVVEAMVVGESCPYCTAMLWVKGGGGDRSLWEAIDRAVRQVNSRLSHPEQIKRWAILANSLSTERGDLTANLKLKRQAVSQRFREVIGALYGEARPPAGVLSLGMAEPEGAG